MSKVREKWVNVGRENAHLRLLLILLLVTNLMQGYFLYKAVGKTSVQVFVPEYLKEDFEVKNGEPSIKYIEQWGLSLIPYISSFTPESADFNFSVLLSHVHPNAYKDIEAEIIRLREEIKSVGISQNFHPGQIAVEGNDVSITGRQVRFVGRTITSDESVTYMLTFADGFGGKPLIESINVPEKSERLSNLR